MKPSFVEAEYLSAASVSQYGIYIKSRSSEQVGVRESSEVFEIISKQNDYFQVINNLKSGSTDHARVKNLKTVYKPCHQIQRMQQQRKAQVRRR